MSSSPPVSSSLQAGRLRKNIGGREHHHGRLRWWSCWLQRREKLRVTLLGASAAMLLAFWMAWQVLLVSNTSTTSNNNHNENNNIKNYHRNNNNNNEKIQMAGATVLTEHKTSATTTTKTTTKNTDSNTPTATVAHVVSLIKCSKSHMVTGFLDAAAVLRHSIHQQSNYTGNSRYSYHMVALVHPSCQGHATTLSLLGFDTKVLEPPISVDKLPPGYYKDHVQFENCCGADEFIKLYAYTLTEYPIVVHWDMDVLVLQSMDALFDAILFPHDSVRGQQAREQLQVQHPQLPLPIVIDAFFTRDITSAQPWEVHQGVQGGFLVARSNRQDFDTYLQFINEANFTRGRGEGSGWGGLGYGGWQGAMAYQGVVAYFYDYYKPNTAVELNACRWNQVVADVIWRGPLRLDLNGTCREHPKIPLQSTSSSQAQRSAVVNLKDNTHCEDCRVTPIELVQSVHYTACKKPWECHVPYPRKSKDARQQYRLNHLTNVTTCGLLFRKWFEARQQVEELLERKLIVGKIPYQKPTPNGEYHPEWFLGYCQGPGRYIAMTPPPTDFDMNRLYA